MPKSVDKSRPHKSKGFSPQRLKERISTKEQQLIHRAVEATSKAQIKETLDGFARREVSPQLGLMKAVSASGQKDARLVRLLQGMAKQAQFGSGLSPQPPDPRWAQWLWWLRNVPPPIFHMEYTPPFVDLWQANPSTEIDLPVDKDSYADPYHYAAKIELADQDGNLSLGGVVGQGLAKASGPDKWLLGDASIAQAQIILQVNIPAWAAGRSAFVSVDISVGNGQPNGTFLNPVSQPGWVGVLGYVNMALYGLGQPVSRQFLNTWASNLPEIQYPIVKTPIWLQNFSLPGTFAVPANKTQVFVWVQAWVSALRLTGVDGYDQNSVGFQFLGAKTNFQTPDAYLPGFGGPGPIRVTKITVDIL
jgi:hypothetical protein